jgi:nucleotide-binding universal stress UspA family protein/YHS domain-containing protein
MKVLVPYDGGELSEQAAIMALELLAQHRLEVLLLRVISNPRQAVEAGEALESMAGALSRSPATVTPMLATGRPAEEIVRHADQHGADLIAMATHGRSDLERMLLGSVTDRVIRSSPVPVLVLHPPTMSIGRISPPTGRKLRVLMPLDGSDFAEDAASMAVSLLRPDLVEVELVSVVATPQTERPLARAFLETAAAALAKQGTSVTTTILEGEPARQIATLAYEGRYDLVVMSTHGHNMLLRSLVGSITDRVLRTSEVPVLVIQPQLMEAPHDPVSGEDLHPDTVTYSSDYHGRVFSFTSIDHKRRFDADPEAYIARRLASPAGQAVYDRLAQVPAAMYDELARGRTAVPSPTREASREAAKPT